MQNVSCKTILLLLCFSVSELEKLYARLLRRLPAKGKAGHYVDKERKDCDRVKVSFIYRLFVFRA